jgi:hypothetical protein
MTDLLAAEFLKLRTTRTTWALLTATVAVSALAVASAVIVGADTATLDLESDHGVRAILNVAANGAIFVLALGIITAAGEYRQGTATDTFLTTPRRWRVIAAKLGVAIAAGVAFGALSAGVAITVANLSYRVEGYTFPSTPRRDGPPWPVPSCMPPGAGAGARAGRRAGRSGSSWLYIAGSPGGDWGDTRRDLDATNRPKRLTGYR